MQTSEAMASMAAEVCWPTENEARVSHRGKKCRREQHEQRAPLLASHCDEPAPQSGDIETVVIDGIVFRCCAMPKGSGHTAV